MARERRQFSEEFRREAVRLAYESGRRLSDVARELDVGTNLIRRWRRRFAGVQEGRAPTTEQQEILSLQRQLSRIREERDILKKALAIFSERRR
jgi:transposase